MGFRDRHQVPDLGIGVGFRPKHAADILQGNGWSQVDWFEVISENFMVGGGVPIENLERLRAVRPVVPHGVSLSIGAVEALDEDYLVRLGALTKRLAPPWFSDHACFCRAAGRDLHDLLPLPHTREAIALVVERIKRVQGEIGRPLALENVSSYLTYETSEMPEWEFISEIAERADCGLLLDVNNIYVSARNPGFDASRYVDAIPADRVLQIHLAGHTDNGTYLLDTHSDHVSDPVWELYARAIKRTGPVSTLIEWDESIPTWEVLVSETERARRERGGALP